MKLGENIKYKVNMDGEQYLKYLKYKDSTKRKFTMPKRYKEALPGFLLATIGVIVLISIWGVFYVPDPEPMIWSWRGVLMFMGVAAGLGWIFHGTGFLLVRR